MDSSTKKKSIYADLSTFDEIEKLLYAGAEAAKIYHDKITNDKKFGDVEIVLPEPKEIPPNE